MAPSHVFSGGHIFNAAGVATQPSTLVSGYSVKAVRGKSGQFWWTNGSSTHMIANGAGMDSGTTYFLFSKQVSVCLEKLL